MNKLNSLAAAAALLAGIPIVAHSATVTETYGPYTPGTVIEDGNPVLTGFLASINTSSILSLTDVSVHLQLVGAPEGSGYANDIFVSLMRADNGVSVNESSPAATLLNQVPGGFDGWNVTFSDSADADIATQSPGSGIVSGLFQPDGRQLPGDEARPRILSGFIGSAGNGDWWLYAADLFEMGQMRLVSWGLTLTGESSLPEIAPEAFSESAVPEASTWITGLGMAVILGLTGPRYWRRTRGRDGARPTFAGPAQG